MARAVTRQYRRSDVDPTSILRWHFSFSNTEGLAFHLYTLPGYPASHGCIRLVERDAQWLYAWGEGWTLDRSGEPLPGTGTPVHVVGTYDFDALPPWRSP
jgi:hypothetical protein